MELALTDTSRWETSDLAAADSGGVTVPAGGSTNTLGSYAVLEAATLFEASGIVVMVSNPSTTSSWLIDIALGAANLERPIITQLYFASARGAQGTAIAFFPIAIPAGSRLTARCQSASASASVQVHCSLVQSGLMDGPPLGRVTSYGSNVAASSATVVAASGSTNTKGAWTQVAASTTFPMRWIVIAVGVGAGNISAKHVFDVGYGASNLEREMITNIGLSTNATSDECVPKAIGAIPCSIPAGSRLVMRLASTTASAAVNFMIYGID